MGGFEYIAYWQLSPRLCRGLFFAVREGSYA
jgi:hypothetical protein